MRIEMKYVVSGDEIERELGIRILDCEFTQMQENDSYVSLALDHKRVKELEEDIKYYEDRGHDTGLVERLKNELYLVKELRLMGYTESILVWVSW